MIDPSAIDLLERANEVLKDWLEEVEGDLAIRTPEFGTERLIEQIDEYLKKNNNKFTHYWYECTKCDARGCLQKRNDDERCYMCGAAMHYQRTVKGIKT